MIQAFAQASKCANGPQLLCCDPLQEELGESQALLQGVAALCSKITFVFMLHQLEER